MALSNFIPQLWSARLHRQNEQRYVYADVTNRNWEGEISAYGDTVKIGTMPQDTITVKDYSKYTDISIEQVDATQQDLIIDQQKYFAFEIDDIDIAQQRPKFMDEAMRAASRQLAGAVDSFISDFHADAGTQEDFGTLDSSNIQDFMAGINETMSVNNNDPAEERYVIVPPWVETLIVKSFQNQTMSSNVMSNGNVGRYFGLNVKVSNAVPNNGSGKDYIMAMTPRAITFAEQIVRTEAFRPENRFSDAVKGLHVYGGKVIEPDALVRMAVDNTT